MVRKRLADEASSVLSSKEMCCVIWATHALPYHLIEDPLFKSQFAPCIPVGLGRHGLHDEMKLLSEKVMGAILAKIGKSPVTLGVDGWTNTRHRFHPPCFAYVSFYFTFLAGRW